MAELLKRKGGLRKAGDADRDPADIAARAPASQPANDIDGAPASNTAHEPAPSATSATASQGGSANASAPTGDDVSHDASDTADIIDIKKAGQADGDSSGRTAGQKAGSKVGTQASRTAHKTAGVDAGRKAGSPARHLTGKTAGGKARRRRGRPPGPARVATTVRILEDLDQALTDACDVTGLGPQDIVEAFLAEGLIRHGHLTEDASDDVQDVLRRVRRRTTPSR